MIEWLTAGGIVVAIGHTNATPAEIRAAIRAGAQLSTHLGNGCPAVLPRHDNCVWEQLAADELLASVIPDGHHLPPAVLKSLVRGKTPSRIVATCDASPLAGLPPGRYAEWGAEFEVQPDGKIVVPGSPYLAGSGAFTDACVANLVRDAGLTLGDALDAAGARPRRLLGLPVPAVAVGSEGPLLLFHSTPDGDMTAISVVG